MTALFITLGISLALFLASIVIGLTQETETSRYYQYLMGQIIDPDSKPQVNVCFGKAARRPARILGTFIL
ncbi:MAG TPA: hypothetical protein VIN59_00915 [Alphaproteobacteria bacterium]